MPFPIGQNSDGTPIQGERLEDHPIIQQLLTATPGGGGSGLQYALARETRPPGVLTDALPPSFVWTPRSLNALTTNIPGCTLVNKALELPAGTYWIERAMCSIPCRAVYSALYREDSGTLIGRYQFGDFYDISQMSNDGYFNESLLIALNAATGITLRVAYDYAFSGYEAISGGLPRNVGEELYSWIFAIKLT